MTFLITEKQEGKNMYQKDEFRRTSDHRETSDPKTIMSELKMFSQNLYRKRSMKTEEKCPKYLSE